MSFSVLHLGNVAQNGYNNAKLLRRLGLETYAVCDEAQALAQPEWEDAPLPAETDAMATWSPGYSVEGWTRPDWVIAPRIPPRRPPGWYRVAYAIALRRALPRLERLHLSLRDHFEPLRDTLKSELTLEDVIAGFRSTWMQSILLGDVGRLFRRFSLVQAYATHAILPLIASPDRPFVAYEHGTLRELPFEDSWRGRLLSLAYRRAANVIITNADVISSARRLGLDDTTFIPHPVDESKYTAGPSAIGDSLRAEAGPIFLAPARQDWREKRNDVMVRALGELVRGGHPKALLLLGDWGEDAHQTRRLVTELGLDANVSWTKPVPKLHLIQLYRAADVVLDQFTFGTFGGIAPEAMACERPVVMAFDRALHDWCFPVPPPIVDARDERTVAEALRRLVADPGERARLGREGRAWVERHHGWRLVAERQRAIYDEVLRPTA
jgi:glycosyltransferase involved in cell wall biosynthesis